MMKERPILFSAPMVRAILDGRKTQTRRVIKPGPIPDSTHPGFNKFNEAIFYPPERMRLSSEADDDGLRRCPYGQPGDRLWVKETFRPDDVSDKIWYRADFSESDSQRAFTEVGEGWKPSIFMPRWASRITLEITGVRVERVQEIAAKDVEAEGIDVVSKLPVFICSPKKPTREKMGDLANTIARDLYQPLWDSLNAKRGYGWDANPWVWAISFKRIEDEGRKP